MHTCKHLLLKDGIFICIATVHILKSQSFMYVCVCMCMYVCVYFNEWRSDRVLVRLGLNKYVYVCVCMYVYVCKPCSVAIVHKTSCWTAP